MNANDSNFTTTLGTRIKEISSTEPFKNIHILGVNYDIVSKFCGYEDILCLSKESYNNLRWINHGCEPKELHKNASTWDDDSWEKYLTYYRLSHHNLPPDSIEVTLRTGWAITMKNFFLTFAPTGTLLHAKFVTNEHKHGTGVFSTYECDIPAEVEASLTSFSAIEAYCRENNTHSS